ncbi:unnamed protein product [Strongylus vulgaris]|uniref:Uncharacterized protein n=1 Tax=Strongylus vulgaris TaxID=40348 RepID=A0A3P7IIF7_STRVU|nr:unnamed protein product [Strongylus vulgaris]
MAGMVAGILLKVVVGVGIPLRVVVVVGNFLMEAVIESMALMRTLAFAEEEQRVRWLTVGMRQEQWRNLFITLYFGQKFRYSDLPPPPLLPPLVPPPLPLLPIKFQCL